MLKIFDAQKISFLLMSGDIFEDKNTTIWELLAALDFFRVAGQMFPTVVTTGNHDELQKGKFQDEYLKLLRIPNVQFISKPEVVSVNVQGVAVKIGAVPWTGLKDQEAFNAVLAPIFNQPDVQIGMLHECFKGIVTDVGYRALKGIQIPDYPQVKYWACGDIHKYQRLNLPSAWMSGAPLQQNFGDAPGKGCIVVEVRDGVYTPKFHRIPSHIELHQIQDIKEIPENSPHWYQLKCEPNKIPLALPDNVVSVDPLPVKIEIPTNMEKENADPAEAGKPYLSIDYADGVDLMMREMGYGDQQIEDEMKFIRDQVR
jgi:DNA repair exonuclease SbcCD nuclease subunit